MRKRNRGPLIFRSEWISFLAQLDSPSRVPKQWELSGIMAAVWRLAAAFRHRNMLVASWRTKNRSIDTHFRHLVGRERIWTMTYLFILISCTFWILYDFLRYWYVSLYQQTCYRWNCLQRILRLRCIINLILCHSSIVPFWTEYFLIMPILRDQQY